MYNGENLIKTDKEYKVCVVKLRERYEKHEGNKHYWLLDNISNTFHFKFERNTKKA